jgi:hypothetical protein
VVSRARPLAAPVERQRTPRGCVLQAAAAAVSVSWFPDAATEAAFGELQVIVWRGVVSRPGSSNRAGGRAVPVREAVLWPEEMADDAWGWRGADDRAFDSAALAAHCQALLDDQLADAGGERR